MKPRKPTGNYSHKQKQMSPEQKEDLLAKLAEAKAKAQQKPDPDTEELIDEAIELASQPDPPGTGG